jgi:hypothetical protein
MMMMTTIAPRVEHHGDHSLVLYGFRVDGRRMSNALFQLAGQRFGYGGNQELPAEAEPTALCQAP